MFKPIKVISSPDCSENPFPFYFKKEKIVTLSGKYVLKKRNRSAPKKE